MSSGRCAPWERQPRSFAWSYRRRGLLSTQGGRLWATPCHLVAKAYVCSHSSHGHRGHGIGRSGWRNANWFPKVEESCPHCARGVWQPTAKAGIPGGHARGMLPALVARDPRRWAGGLRSWRDAWYLKNIRYAHSGGTCQANRLERGHRRVREAKVGCGCTGVGGCVGRAYVARCTRSGVWAALEPEFVSKSRRDRSRVLRLLPDGTCWEQPHTGATTELTADLVNSCEFRFCAC